MNVCKLNLSISAKRILKKYLMYVIFANVLNELFITIYNNNNIIIIYLFGIAPHP